MIRRLARFLEGIWSAAGEAADPGPAMSALFCPVCGGTVEDGACVVCDWSEDDVE